MNHEVFIIDDGGTLTATVKEIFQEESAFKIKHATPDNIDEVLRLLKRQLKDWIKIEKLP